MAPFKLSPFLVLLVFSFVSFSQVGIGTYGPKSDSYLDVHSDNKGILFPRISIPNFETFTLPNGSMTESLLLFNTNTILGNGLVTWNGSKWTHLNHDFYWGTYGSNTTGSGEYLGTMDSQDFLLATSNTPRLLVKQNGRLHNYSMGTITFPSLALNNSLNGFYSSGDNFHWSIQNKEILNISASTGLTVNPGQLDQNFKVASSTSSKLLHIDADLNGLTLNKNSLNEATLHIQGSSSDLIIEGLAHGNDPNNNGLDKSLLYVDSNGQFKLETTPHITQLPQLEVENSFLGTSEVYFAAVLGKGTESIYTTSQELFEDGLLEVVYQVSVEVFEADGTAVTNGKPNLFGVKVVVDGREIATTSKMYTSMNSSNIATGFMYLNGKGYVPLTGDSTGTTHNIEVFAFYDGGEEFSAIRFGESDNDMFQIIVHY